MELTSQRHSSLTRRLLPSHPVFRPQPRHPRSTAASSAEILPPMGNHAAPFLLVLLLAAACLFRPSAAEIKTLEISGDGRPLILFERFGFTHRGTVFVFVSAVSFSSSLAPPDPSLLGFFLLSDDSLLQAAAESRRPDATDSDSNASPGCVLSSSFVKRLFTFAELSPAPESAYNRSFPVSHPDEYSLFFANCAPETQVSMQVHTEMYNSLPNGSLDYLSVGQAPVPALYAALAAAYTTLLAAWLYLSLARNRAAAHHIHHLMSLLLAVKVLYLLCAAEDQHYVRATGTPHGWDVLFYTFQFLKGMLLFAVIVLVGTGWSFLRPFLQEREKKVLIAVIPLQVAANVATVVMGETGPFIRDWVTWKQVFILVDVACCAAVLFPIVWSIRALKETSKTDGKAARNLAKLTLFRQFYVVVISYLYFTRIIMYPFGMILSYKYRWLSIAAEEVAGLAFYLFMYYMFRPVERNRYFVLDDQEEEAAEAALHDHEEFEL